MPAPSTADLFILSAFDREQWCPVLQALFGVDDLAALRSILGACAAADPELRHLYWLDGDQLSAIVARFSVPFDPAVLEAESPDIQLFRKPPGLEPPYLVHTGYELPLLLDGRKQLARMTHEYPPDTFDGEDRFDRWVARGVLSKHETTEPLGRPIKGCLGVRTVFYTPVGEEWRVPAMQLLSRAAGRSGGWNEHFERLEGMLFGYSDAENDWWIEVGLQGGGFGGVSICCAVSREGLAWIEAAGFRALPPSPRPSVTLRPCHRHHAEELAAPFLEDPEAVAVVRANVLGRHLHGIVDLRTAGPWNIPSNEIPVLNRHLRGSVTVIATRTVAPPPSR
jgi:hypothetical protein